MVYQLVEIAATLVENTLILSTITQIAGKKYSGIKHICLIQVLNGIMAVTVSYLNSMATFSFVTIIVGIAYAIFSTRLTSNGSVLLRSVACMLIFFFLHSCDYVLGFSIGLFIEQASDLFHTFDLLMHPGLARTIYTLADKSIQIVVFFVLRPVYTRIGLLNQRFQIILLPLITIAYVLMSLLTNMIIMESLVIMQVSVILSWIFIMICVCVVIAMIMVAMRYQQEKQEKEMISLTNELMEKNYRQINESRNAVSKQVHDFTNHLRALGGMVEQDSKAAQYIRDLLKDVYKHVNLCHSGNDVIDAVINCKAAEASEAGIRFSYTVRLPENLQIAPVDLCAVLSNQLDNAIEACQRILQEEKREVQLLIGQKYHFLFFKVINTTACDPFDARHNLITTKLDKTMRHGLGLKNIRDTVEKYGGTLENSYEDGRFTSVAMLQIPFDT